MIEFKDIIKDIDFDEKAQILKAISHPIRLRIVFAVHQKACNVKSMWQCLNLPQDVVSQHLAILRKKNVLTTRKEGNSVFYSVREGIDLGDLIKFLQK